MARSFIIRQGEDEDPEFDLTEPDTNVHVIWEEIEAGGRAFRGESTTQSVPMRDEQGETGNPADLPGGLTFTSISRGSRWEWLEGAIRMAVGRVGVKDYSRGRQKADRAREMVMQAADGNEDLQLILIDGWERPAENDVERVNGLITDYLTANGRPSTTISNTYVADSNHVNLDAKTYDGTNPHAILTEISQIANKNFFVTVDDELWYDSWISTTYPAGVRISDRPEEWDDSLDCDDASELFLGSAADNSGSNFASDHPAWAGDNEERAEMSCGFGVAVGDTIIAVVAYNDASVDDHDGETVYDEQGNTWTLDATHEHTASSQDDTIEIWRCNVTNALDEGDYIRFAVNVGSSLVATQEAGGRCIAAWVYRATLDNPTVGTGAGAISSTPSITAPAGDVVVAGLSWSNHTKTANADADWDAFVPSTNCGASAGTNDKSIFAQQLADQGGTNAWTPTLSGGAADWAAIAVGYDRSAAGGVGLPTFGPKWDVGPASSEDGLDSIRCGIRLYYGNDGAFVYLHDDTVHEEYWHAEESYYTSDPTINTEARANVLAAAIHDRLKNEERTYNLSIGPLTETHIGCIKYGQLIAIKARAIPDADDQYVLRRIAQLHWTTPRPGMFWARLQLSRPRKEAPYSVGPKQAMEETTKHQTTGNHPASNITVVDSGGHFTEVDVEGVLQEIGEALGSVSSSTVVDHGTMGASEDFDFTDGTDHEGVLDENLTVTLSGATNGEAAWMTLKLTQDGTGTNTIDLPASVANAADVESAFDTAANAVNVLTVFTYDGGTTWYAFLAAPAGGGGGGGAYTAEVQAPQSGQYLMRDGTWRDPLVSGTGELTVGSPATVTDDSDYNAWPVITRISENRILLVYTKADSHHEDNTGRAVGKIGTETNGGAISWGSEFTIYDHASLFATAYGVTRLSTGRIIVTLWRDDFDTSGTGEAGLVYSDDDTVSWSEWVDLTNAFTQEAYASGPVVELPDGELVVTIEGSDTGDPVLNRSSHLLRSSDQGETWGDETSIRDYADDTRPYYETKLVLLDNDTLLAVHRTSASTGTHYTQTSDDYGATWSTPASAFDGYGAPSVIQSSTGTIFVVTRQNSDAAAIAYTSTDQGATWSAAEVLDDAMDEMEYGQFVELLDGRLIAVYGAQPTSSTSNSDIDMVYVTEAIEASIGGGTVTEEDVRDAGRWEVVVSESPPEAMYDGDDWLYAWVSD